MSDNDTMAPATQVTREDEGRSSLIERIDALEAELSRLRQQVSPSLLQPEFTNQEVLVMECAIGGIGHERRIQSPPERDGLEGAGSKLGSRARVGLLFEEVEEVIPMVQYTPLPETQPWVLGSLNLRGQSAVVVDLTHRLLGTPHLIDAGEFIVICRTENHRVGLLVDDIVDIVTFPGAALQHPAPGVAFASYLIAVIHEEERSLPIVAVDRVVGRGSGPRLLPGERG